MTELLGLPLADALDALDTLGVRRVHIQKTQPPRGAHAAGVLRVVRVQEGGARLTVCRFLPDDVSACCPDERRREGV